jgi:hypothetical protein
MFNKLSKFKNNYHNLIIFMKQIQVGVREKVGG